MGPDALWSIRVPTSAVLWQNSAADTNKRLQSAVSRPPEQGLVRSDSEKGSAQEH